MVPQVSRRRWLAAGWLALASGFAGCSLRRVTDTPQSGGRTFSFEIENRISPDALEAYPPIDGTPPAKVTVVVEANGPDGSERDVVNETLSLDPGTTRRLEDAFTTETDGTSYIVTVKLGEFQRYEAFGHDPEFHSAGHRFTPGGFGDPAGDTFGVTVVETEPKGQYFKPKISLSVPDGET